MLPLPARRLELIPGGNITHNTWFNGIYLDPFELSRTSHGL
jgi:hypothetical protein